MRHPFRVDCLAYCDVEEARRFLDARKLGLGDQFASAVAETWEQIARDPLRRRCAWREFRKWRVSRFPYAVIYMWDGQTADILVVTHLHRHPDAWKKRVESD